MNDDGVVDEGREKHNKSRRIRCEGQRAAALLNPTTPRTITLGVVVDNISDIDEGRLPVHRHATASAVHHEDGDGNVTQIVGEKRPWRS